MNARNVILLASCLWLAAAPVTLCAESKGLIQRVGKVEETVFGAQHKDKPLHARIIDLEKETVGSNQTGPLSKRVEGIEKSVDGKVSTPPVTHTTATLPAPKTPVPETKSEYMPPIAPQLDIGAGAPTEAPKVSTEPANVDGMLRDGTAAFHAGRTDEAEKTFRDVLTKSPFNSNACFNLGAIAEARGDLAGALGNYRAALIGSPNDHQVQEAIAQVESQIAAKSDSPFKNPLLSTTKDGGTLLQGSASDFVSQQPVQPPTNLSGAANAQQQQPIQGATRSGWRTAGVMGAAIAGSVASGALRGAIGGGGTSGIINGVVRGAMRGVAGRSSWGGAAGFITGGPLHCPICRIIPGF